MDTSETEVSKVETQSDSSVPSELAPTRSGKPWFWRLLISFLATGGIILWRMFAPGGTPPSSVAQQQGPPPKPIETISLASGSATRSVQLLGQVEATQQSTIRAQTGGIVKQISVQPGDRVKVGMAIALLDDTDQQLAISQARAQLAQQRSNLARLEVGTRPEIIAQRQAAVTSAKARELEAQDNLKRTSDLVKEGALSQRLLVEAQAQLNNIQGERLEAEAELAEAKAGPIQEEIAAQRANVEAAKATLAQAELARQRTRILASESGIVQTRHISNGDLVQSSGEIVTLVAGDRFDIFLELPEELSGKVTPGMTIDLTTRALPQWKQRATITAVVPSAETASRRQRVRVQINKPPSGLIPGMAIAGNLNMPSNRSSFVVSRDALTRRQNEWLVFAVADGKAKQIPVEMVSDMGKNVAIYHPTLRTGQRIVLRGGDGLQDGAPVKIVDPT
ncbi:MULTISPECIES: efflux RND transporter periplasmic adaptor subunit [unclassified Nostoc]|uniref:efflux RND transporter periplasmic adaptor subunit n=1 Tax=unclassified Nostoc TaxID=2593658 RepID=UPI0025AA983E|nr:MULTISPECIES: efflux RND transporter periplasmic adaptor subunit [unclassified Nostoc]MDM9583223.1 efflux RND transporter periplasmic adaptor subunit [Nostoc sp. GT001]MDZ7943607.1 efflux RND transporter periplasmic adaptor subunit [Nostoc sp. EfeVER01]MDZ7992680.1 efflux RND transporter periplasmic adaptor subunit [Nostoc sp. EspVER01]